MTPAALQVERPLLVLVRCRWCGKPIVELEPGVSFRLKHCGVEQVGTT